MRVLEGFRFVLLLVCVTGGFRLLPCGEETTLTSQNASNALLKLGDCHAPTVVRLLSGNAENLTLVVVNASNIWIELEGVQLVNSRILITNVTVSTWTSSVYNSSGCPASSSASCLGAVLIATTSQFNDSELRLSSIVAGGSVGLLAATSCNFTTTQILVSSVTRDAMIASAVERYALLVLGCHVINVTVALRELEWGSHDGHVVYMNSTRVVSSSLVTTSVEHASSTAATASLLAVQHSYLSEFMCTLRGAHILSTASRVAAAESGNRTLKALSIFTLSASNVSSSIITIQNATISASSHTPQLLLLGRCQLTNSSVQVDAFNGASSISPLNSSRVEYTEDSCALTLVSCEVSRFHLVATNGFISLIHYMHNHSNSNKNGICLTNSNITSDSSVWVSNVSLLALSGVAFYLFRTTLKDSRVTLSWCNLSSARQAFLSTRPLVQNSSVFITHSQLTSNHRAVSLDSITSSGLMFCFVDCLLSALEAGVTVLDSQITQTNFTFVNSTVASPQYGIQVQNCSGANAILFTLHNVTVSVEFAAAVHLTQVECTSLVLRVQSSRLSSDQSYALQLSSVSFEQTTVSLHDSVLIAGTIGITVLTSTLVHVALIVERAAVLSFLRGIEMSDVTIAQSSVKFLSADIASSTDICFLLLDATLVDSILYIRNSSLQSALSHAVFFQSLRMAHTEVSLLQSDMLSQLSAFAFQSAAMDNSSLLIRDSQMNSSDHRGALFQNVSCSHTRITLAESSVLARDISVALQNCSVRNESNVSITHSTIASGEYHGVVLQFVIFSGHSVMSVSECSLVSQQRCINAYGCVLRQEAALLLTMITAASYATRAVMLEALDAQEASLVVSECKLSAPVQTFTLTSGMFRASELLVFNCIIASVTSVAVGIVQTSLVSSDLVFRNSSMASTDITFVVLRANVVAGSSIAVHSATCSSSDESAVYLQNSMFNHSTFSLVTSTLDARWFGITVVISGIHFLNNSALDVTEITVSRYVARGVIFQLVSVVSSKIALASSSASVLGAAVAFLDVALSSASSLIMSQLQLSSVAAQGIVLLRVTIASGSVVTIENTSIVTSSDDCVVLQNVTLLSNTTLTVRTTRIQSNTRGITLQNVTTTQPNSQLTIMDVHLASYGYGLAVVGARSANALVQNSLIMSQASVCCWFRAAEFFATILVSSLQCAGAAVTFEVEAQPPSKQSFGNITVIQSNLSATMQPSGCALCSFAASAAAEGLTTAYVLDSVRVSGYDRLLASEVTASLTVYCSWWSAALLNETHNWRLLSKVDVGSVSSWQALPQFRVFSRANAGVQCGNVSATATWSNPSSRTFSASGFDVSETTTAVRTSSCNGSITLSLPSTKSLLGSGSGSTTVTLSPPSMSRTGDGTATVRHAMRMVAPHTSNTIEYAPAVGAAIAVTSVATVFAGLTSQRIAFVLRTTGVHCGALPEALSKLEALEQLEEVDWLSSPIQIELGDSSLGRMHRGAVVGNLCLCGGVALLALAAAAVCSRNRNTALSAEAIHLHIRQIIAVPVLLLAQPTMVSSVCLLQLAATRFDVLTCALGCLGVAGVALFSAIMFYVVAWPFPFRAHAIAARFWKATAQHDVSSSVQRSLHRLMWSSVEWRSQSWAPHFVSAWGFLFDSTRERRHWWAAVDLCMSLLLGGLSTIAPHTPLACRAGKWGVVTVSVVALGGALALNPMNSLHGRCSTTVLLGLQTLLALLSALESDSAVIEVFGILTGVVSWLLAVPLAAVALRRHLKSDHIHHRQDTISLSLSSSVPVGRTVPRYSTRVEVEHCRANAHPAAHVMMHQERMLLTLVEYICSVQSCRVAAVTSSSNCASTHEV